MGTVLLRAGDVVVTTPSKCGTTWMQHIVGMMLLDRVDFGVRLGTVSPWLDMLIRSEDEVFSLLQAQEHRRFIKTHTPLDGLPDDPRVTYIVVIRHPLDVALSDLDHDLNGVDGRTWELRRRAVGEPDPATRRPVDWEPPPQGEDPRERRTNRRATERRRSQPRTPNAGQPAHLPADHRNRVVNQPVQPPPTSPNQSRPSGPKSCRAPPMSTAMAASSQVNAIFRRARRA